MPDIEGLIAEAWTIFAGLANYDIRNDVLALLLMKNLQDQFGLAVDLEAGRECVLRLLIAARTGIYPRYLLLPSSPQ